MQTILLWFCLINGLYIFRTFTCPSSGVQELFASSWYIFLTYIWCTVTLISRSNVSYCLDVCFNVMRIFAYGFTILEVVVVTSIILLNPSEKLWYFRIHNRCWDINYKQITDGKYTSGFYCRSYCLLNMFRAPLRQSSGAQKYYTVVAACGISCCGFQVAGLVWSW